MSRKTRVAIVLSALVVLLLAVGVSLRRREMVAKRVPQRPGVDDREAAGEAPAIAPAAKAPPPAPSLVNTSAGDTRRELDACLEERRRLLVQDQPQYFNLMRPSTRNQTLIGPIVERVMSRFSPKPSYSLECRVSSCRFSALSADEGLAKAWFDALGTDQELSRLRNGLGLGQGLSGISSVESRSVKDSLTGAALTVRDYYFSLPFLPPSSPAAAHPFDTTGDPSPEVPATAADCLAEVAGMRMSLAKLGRNRIARTAMTGPRDAARPPGAVELTPQERELVKAANERYQARAQQVSREILADLKGLGPPGPGEMTLDERLELFRIVNGEWNSNRLQGSDVSEIVKKHKRSLAQYWKATLLSGLPAERAREVLSALRAGKVDGLSLPRPPLMGENPKGETFVVGWTDGDWQN